MALELLKGKEKEFNTSKAFVLQKKSRDVNSSFTVSKISFGEGVERTFALYSPIIGSIKVVRSGKVRRAKLYYLRDRKGKSARISEKIKKSIGIDIAEPIDETENAKETVVNENEPKKDPDKVDLKKDNITNSKDDLPKSKLK